MYNFHFLLRMTRLRFTMNIIKSQMVPSLHAVHLGFICSSPDLRFRETIKGAAKLVSARTAVRRHLDISWNIPLKVLAKFVGRLWARKLLMHRAVAIMTRGMVDALATQLRISLGDWLSSAKRRQRVMARILKHSWSGSFAWSAVADYEFRFWETVDFLEQEAPMRYDSADEALRRYVLRPQPATVRRERARQKHSGGTVPC